MRIAITAAVLGLCASLGFAACGGDDGGDKPTKTEYIAKADAICKSADDKIQADAQKEFGNTPPTQQQILTYQKEKVLPALEKESSDLKALDKPEGDEDELNALYDSLDSSIEKAKNAPTIEDSLFADANQKAKAYGLKQCGANN